MGSIGISNTAPADAPCHPGTPWRLRGRRNDCACLDHGKSQISGSRIACGGRLAPRIRICDLRII